MPSSDKCRPSLSRFNCSYDVVITTYGTVQSEVKSVLGDKADKEAKSKLENIGSAEDICTGSTSGTSELLNVGWERIILDEAHQVYHLAVLSFVHL